MVTIRDGDRDYSVFQTYATPTSIAALCTTALGGASGVAGAGSENDCQELDAQWGSIVLDELRNHLDELGYREVTAQGGEQPDIFLFVGAVMQSRWDLATPPTYCYDDGEDFGGCWKATYSLPYDLPTNTVLIDMAVATESTHGELSSAWTAILPGLPASTTQQGSEQRVRETMGRAFAQSPYLRKVGVP